MKSIKLIILLFLILSKFSSSFAQTNGIITNGGQIVIQNNGVVNIQGGNYTNQTNGVDGKLFVKGKFYLSGNWTNNAAGVLNTGSDGSIIFNGSANQTISGTNSTIFNAILAANNNSIVLANSITVDSLINLQSGNFILSNFNLNLSENAKIENYAYNRYIVAENNGKLNQTVSSSPIVFPIGISTSYSPVFMRNTGTKDNFGIRIQNGVLDQGTAGIAVVSHVVDKTYVISESIAGGSNLSLTLQWNGTNEYADFIRDSCGIGQFLNSTSKWETQLAGQAAGIDPYQKSITGIPLDIGDNAFIIGDKYSDGADGTKPTLTNVTIASNHSNSDWARAGSVVNLNFTADEAVQANPTVTFSINGVAVTNAISVSSLGGNSYLASFTVNAADQEGLINFTINYTDIKGNTGLEVSTTTDNTKVYTDLTNPTITSIAISSNNANDNQLAKVGDEITIQYILSEISDGLPTSTILGNPAAVAQVSGLNYTSKYTTLLSNSEGIVPFTIQYTDRAGNTSVSYIATTNSSQIRFDKTIPSLSTVTLLSSNAVDNQLATQGDEITLSFSSTETLNATPTVNMQIGATVLSGYTINPTGTALNYTVKYTVSPSDLDGNINFTIDFEDLAGNTGTTVNTTTNASAIAVDLNLPTASTSGATTFCQTDSSLITIDLTGDTPWNLTYTDGTTPTTVNGILSSPYQFYVKTAGTYEVTQLSDASGHFAVDFGTKAQIFVNPLPTPSFTTNFTTYSTSSAAEILSGLPAGGVFSGIGITSIDSTFHPDIAGPQTNMEIKYTYTDANSCTDSVSVFVDVLKSDANIINISDVYCYTTPNSTITGTNPISAIGEFYISGGTGLTDNNDNTATIFPALIGSGIDTITYRYFDGTWLSAQHIIKIDSISSTLDFVGLASQYCADASTVTLVAQNLFPANGTVNWTGPVPDFPGSGNTKSFSPTLLSANADYTIGLTYTTPDGCISPSIDKTFHLYPLPTLNFSLKDNYNIDSSAVQLTASPIGGTFSGAGITGNLFVPSVVGPQSPVNISYTYTDVNTCTNVLTVATETRKASGILANVDPTYCYDGATVSFIGSPETGAITSRFISKKNGIISTSGNTADYNPATAGQGSDTITYVYNLRGTEYWIKKTTFVDSIGNVDFISLKNEYCDGDSIVSLTGIFNHLAGNGSFLFSGDGSAFANYGNTATFRPITVIADDLPRTISFTYTSSISGCSQSISKNTIVHPLPSLDFDLAANYNVNGSSDTLSATPSGGNYSGLGMSGDVFYPELAGIGTGYNITYTYQNPITTCINSLVKQTNVQEADAVILGLDSVNIYCYDEPIDTIYGKAINGLPGGFFGGDGITNLSPDTALFDPVSAGNGTHIITYYYIGNDGITQFTTQESIWVDSLGTASINGLLANYCEDEPMLNIFGSPQNSNGIFYGNGINNNGNGTAAFTASLANIGSNTIDFVYTNPASGCAIYASQLTTIHALPIVDFSISDQCIADSIRFTDLTASIDNIQNWHWNFGDNDNVLENESFIQNPSHLYTTDGLKQIQIDITTNAGCQSSTTKIIDFGSNPTADFSWSNECFGTGSTQFTNLASGGNIISYDWDFGDGNASNAFEPIHQFDSVANYPVTLAVNTLNNCTDTAKYTVYVRPYVKSYPYAQDFELGPGGWVAQSIDSINSWEWGIPNGNTIDTAASGSYSWMTGLNQSYQNNENSYVVGPCFDFSGMTKPMIAIKTWTNSDFALDGTVLQYSIDDGNTWQNVGSNKGDGLNWFNTSSIKGTPGGQDQGWTGTTDTTWIEARHDLNNLIGETNIRFRVAFGSDASYIKDGFAFDDIWIGERKRKVVLENFTNSSDLNSWTSENNIMSINATYPYDAIPIFYHTNTKGTDAFYSANPDVPDAINLHYGISSIPYTVMDGINNFSYSSSMKASDLILRALEEPKFNILTTSNINKNDTLNELWLDIRIEATEDIENDVVLQTVIVENVNGIIVGNNGQTNFSNVVRDMIPDAAGTLFSHSWTKNQSDSISLKQVLPQFYSPNDYRIIVYVQDITTKEIYQSTVIENNTIVTELENIETDKNMEIKIYPNPAIDFVRIVIPKIKSQGVLTINNELGQQVKLIPTQQDTQLIDLQIGDFKTGIYFIQYKSQSGYRLSAKLIKTE